MSDDKAVDEFLSYLNLQKRFSPLTTKNYAVDLKQFFNFLNQEVYDSRLSEISYQHVRSFIASLIDKKKSTVSVNRKISCLKSFFKYALKNNLISNNPMQKIQGPKTPKRLPVFIDENQIDKIFNQLKFDSGFEGIRNKLLIDVLYQTGLRRAELINLKETDLDLISLQLKVLGKRNKERIIPFSIHLKRSIQEYLNAKQENNLINSFLFVNLKKERKMTHPILSLV